MLDQSRELNMLACLLFALASGSFACFHRDVFPFFFCAMSSNFSFPISSKTVSRRCSFCFHVDNNRATADASYESRLSASRDIRSIRIAITVPCQQRQQESFVMPLSCNCKRKNASLRCHHTSFCGTNASKSIKYLVLVIRNACFAQSQNCLVTMAFNFIITVPAPIRLFWVQYRYLLRSKTLA